MKNMLTSYIYLKDKKLESQIFELINNTSSIEVLRVLNNNMELLERLHRFPIDILFISTSNRGILSLVNHPPFVILVDEPGIKKEVVDSQKYFDRLTSPINEEKLCNVLGKVFHITNRYNVLEETNSLASEKEANYHTQDIDYNDEFMFIKEGKNKQKIVYDEVMYVKNAGYALQIQQGNDKVNYFRSSLKRLLDILPQSKFVRISKSLIINFHKVEFFKNQEVILNDKTVLPVSRIYHKRLRELMRLKHL